MCWTTLHQQIGNDANITTSRNTRTDRFYLSPEEPPADPRFSFEAASDPSAYWEDFSYPLYTKPCFTAGCISTVTKDIYQPTWMAQGSANKPNDTIYIITRDPFENSVQLLPPTSTSWIGFNLRGQNRRLNGNKHILAL